MNIEEIKTLVLKSLDSEIELSKKQLNGSSNDEYIRAFMSGIDLSKCVVSIKLSANEDSEDEDEDDEGEDVILFERDEEGKVVIYPEACEEIK
jgi:hypothetical protein